MCQSCVGVFVCGASVVAGGVVGVIGGGGKHVVGALNSFEQFVIRVEPEGGDVEFKEAVPWICRWKIGP